MKMNIIGFPFVALSLLPSIGNGQDKLPNIQLLISDQHSGKIMTQTGYQYIKTPGIDKLAAEGVTFTRNYCTYPVCVASRTSIMTGMMPGISMLILKLIQVLEE